jgi:hypothetical protein
MAAGLVDPLPFDTVPLDVAYALAVERTVRRASELRRRSERFTVQSLFLTAAALWSADLYNLLHAVS